MGIADGVPPNLKFAILILIIPIFTLYTLALVGCVSLSPGVPNIYLFRLKVNEVTLRVGYFAVCAIDLAANGTSLPFPQNRTANASDGTICTPTFGLNGTELSVKLFGTEGEVVPILDLALILQRKILVPLILVAAFLMLFGAIFFALAKVTQMKLKDMNTFDSAMKQLGIFKPATLAMLWMSVLFAFGAAVASNMAIGALNFIIPVLAINITVTGGRILQAFQYLSFIFGALFALGATLMLADKLEQQQRTLAGEKASEEVYYDDSMMPQQDSVSDIGNQPEYDDGAYGNPDMQDGYYQAEDPPQQR